LAEKTEVDPSYLTLIERDGYVPRRDIVGRFGLALQDSIGAYVAAEYLPPRMGPTVSRALRDPSITGSLPLDIVEAVRLLAQAPKTLREQTVAVINAMLSTATEKAASKPPRKPREHLYQRGSNHQ
jgi:hypothetical protein